MWAHVRRITKPTPPTNAAQVRRNLFRTVRGDLISHVRACAEELLPVRTIPANKSAP